MIEIVSLLMVASVFAANERYPTKPQNECGIKCPRNQHCELVVNPCLIPPCPTSPKCIPDCPKGQIWVTCPSCTETRNCVTIHLGLLCRPGCYPAQCICPDQKLLNNEGVCVDQQDCQPFEDRMEIPYR